MRYSFCGVGTGEACEGEYGMACSTPEVEWCAGLEADGVWDLGF